MKKKFNIQQTEESQKILSFDNIEQMVKKNYILIKVVEDKVLFPGLVGQITIDKKDHLLDIVKNMHKSNINIGIIKRKNSEEIQYSYDNIHTIGTLAQILDIVIKPENKVHVLLKGIKKFTISNISKTIEQDKDLFFANIDIIKDNAINKLQKKDKVLLQSLKDSTIELLRNDPEVSSEIEDMVKDLEAPAFLSYFAMSGTSAPSIAKQKLLEETNVLKKVKLSLKYVYKDLDFSEIKKKIRLQIHKEITDQQKEFYLRQEIKALQSELGDNQNSELKNILDKAKCRSLPKDVFDYIKKTVEKVERIPSNSPEFPTYVNHVEFLVSLPWEKYTKDNFDIDRAEKILNKRHYGMDKVKQRVLEYLAVLKLKKEIKGQILCLYGPPGVGKTSLGKSVAESLKRKYARISLGSLSDEADIKGHRKTYIGAMPGKILHNIKLTDSSNPVIVLDEIDKINDKKGNPSAALLELLDPEQNNAFIDNFVEIPFDLSKVIFIATANDISQIPHALRDRMELIEITGYTLEDKVEIAKKFIIPNQRTEHGLKSTDISISNKAIEKIIKNYTYESGVRGLKRQIASVNRRIAKNVALGHKYDKRIKEKNIIDILGCEKYSQETYQKIMQPGIAVGLAYTSVGGDIIYIETCATKGKGKLTISGRLGEVMKESAMAALSFLRSMHSYLDIDTRLFEQYDLHIHVPDGATPKDGPSAGITIATALASLYTQRKLKDGIAMTGEITLRGKILPVGGIKEKLLAAKRSGMSKIILCHKNKKDVSEIKEKYISDLTFYYVESFDEVIDIALESYKTNKYNIWDLDTKTSVDKNLILN